MGKTPHPQYGNIPQREVGYKRWPFLLHSLKLGIAKMCCFNYLSNWPRWKLIQLLISHVFCVPCCLFEIFLSRMSQFDLSSNINVRSNYDSMFSSTKWQLFSEMEATVILWRGQRTASCFLTMRHNWTREIELEK